MRLAIISRLHHIQRLACTSQHVYLPHMLHSRPDIRSFHSSVALEKGKSSFKGRKKEEPAPKRKPSIYTDFEEEMEEDEREEKAKVKQQDINEEYEKALDNLRTHEKSLVEAVAKHFNTKIDVNVFEKVKVKLANGREMLLEQLAQISIDGAKNMIIINFGENPGTLDAAKLAIEKSGKGVNPLHEGHILKIFIPRMTREKRQEIIKNADKVLYTQFKVNIDKVYAEFERLSKAIAKNKDEGVKMVKNLLGEKKKLEEKGKKMIEGKKSEIMKELF